MSTADAPLGVLAEVTHRCPLHCPYCSNPLELVSRDRELDTAQWCDVFAQARDLGVLQIHLSGGEPLGRPDLTQLVRHARELGCYVSLVTSGLGLTPERATELVAAGLDHVQLSVQDADPVSADRIAGTRAHNHKVTAAALIDSLGVAFSVNVVLHRANIERVGAIIELAAGMGADRLELANTQYYGWALRNRNHLMPSREQVTAAEQTVQDARSRHGDRMDISYVLADYHEDLPKPCMHGWGSRQLTISPDGAVLPCPAATAITTLPIENVVDRPLREIWYEGPTFNAYRGTSWMREPCISCSRRDLDFGGCRCQAFQLTGDAAATDPVCRYSPDRPLVDALLAESELVERSSRSEHGSDPVYRG